eukprot:scaffold4265_cov127-Amphora_coffeaeformis.AAC.2
MPTSGWNPADSANCGSWDCGGALGLRHYGVTALSSAMRVFIQRCPSVLQVDYALEKAAFVHKTSRFGTK